jgi:zinc-ribbon domain
MSVSVFCESCGRPVTSDAKFCESCGAALRPDPAEPQPSGDRQQRSQTNEAIGTGADMRRAAERLEAVTPGATELASQLAGQIRTPAVTTALVGGAAAAAVVFGIGVLLAIVTTDQSMLGAADVGKGVIKAGFAQMLNFVQASYSHDGGKLGPALFVVFPIAACAIAAVTQAGRTRHARPRIRLMSGAGIGVVFGLLMLVPALATGGRFGDGGSYAQDPNAASAVLLGVLWGSIGGLLGTYYALRRDPEYRGLGRVGPPVVGDVARTILAAMRPLAVVLAVMTIAGGIVWAVQTVRRPSLHARSSTVVATIDHTAFAVEHGLHWTELGGLAQFRSAFGDEVSDPRLYPVPAKSEKIKLGKNFEYRLFGFSDALPAYVFLPLVAFVIGIPLVFALYAGFAVARLRGAAAPLIGAAWGALVGPIWAITIVVIHALIAKDVFGRAQGDSAFGMFLLGGAVIGAIGGLIATQSRSREALPVTAAREAR